MKTQHVVTEHVRSKLATSSVKQRKTIVYLYHIRTHFRIRYATHTYSVNNADDFPSSTVIVPFSRVLCGGIKCVLLRLLVV